MAKFLEKLTNDFKWNYDLAAVTCLIIFTPFILLISWLLTKLVDDPAKELAYGIAIVMKEEKPIDKV